MQTQLTSNLLSPDDLAQADHILRACVHCGFCTATCPTYQLLGDELDGPRGRIYLIKQMLEGQPVTANTRLHLDRCLSCRSCETTCPSGVEYSKLLNLGRKAMEKELPGFKRYTDRDVKGVGTDLSTTVIKDVILKGREEDFLFNS